MDMSYASYKEYCDSLDALHADSTPASNEAGTEESKAAEDVRKGEKDVEGGMRRRQGKNKMLETLWPPENVQEMHLERW